MGLKKHIYDLANGAAAAFGFCYIVGCSSYFIVRVGNSDRKANTLKYFDVWCIVADKCAFFRGDIGFVNHFFKSNMFFVVTLLDKFDAELSTTQIDNFGFSSRDNSRSNTRAMPEFQAVTITNIKRL